MIDGFGSDTHLWLWVPAFAGTTTEWRGTDSNFKQPITDTPPRSRRAGARVLSATSRHLNQRAQGMPGARSARSRAWCVVNTRVSHHGHAGNTRHSPRNGFNGFLRALPGDRALLPPSSAENSANLTPASGRQDHTTSPSASAPLVSAPPKRPSHPAPN